MENKAEKKSLGVEDINAIRSSLGLYYKEVAVDKDNTNNDYNYNEIAGVASDVQKVIQVIGNIFPDKLASDNGGNGHKVEAYKIKEGLLGLSIRIKTRDKLNEIFKENDLEALTIKRDDLLEYYNKITINAIDECQTVNKMHRNDKTYKNDKMHGKIFLRKAILDGVNGSEFDLDNDTSSEIARIQKVIDEITLDGRYTGAALLLYYISGKDLKLVKKIVDKQIDSKGGWQFFSHLFYFLGVYGDITQYLIEDTKEEKRRKDIQENGKKILFKIINDNKLCEKEINQENKKDNLFMILSEELKNGKEEDNPWILNTLEDTPFIWENVGNLVSNGIDRESQAYVISLLNNYHKVLFSVKIDEIKKLYTHYKNIDNEVDQEKVLKEVIQKLRSLMDKHRSSFSDLGVDPKTAFNINDPDLEEKIDDLHQKNPYDQEGLQKMFYAIKTDKYKEISPLPVLLRLVDFEKISYDPELQNDFMRLVSLIDGIDNSTNLTLLKDSLKFIFEKKDPYLLVPLGIFQGKNGKMPYELLTEIAQKKLPAKDIKDLSLDIEREEGEKLANIKKDFFTAGVGYERSFLHSAACIIKKREIPFENIMSFFEKTISECLSEKDDYDVFAEYTATHIFDDFVKKLGISKNDNIVSSNQEYSRMTKGISNVHTFDITRFRSAEEAAQKIVSLTNDKTQLILLSSATRYGDKLFSEIEDENKDSGFIAKLIQRLHELLPNDRVYLKDLKTGEPENMAHQIMDKQNMMADNYVQVNNDTNNWYPRSAIKRKYIPIIIDKVQELGRYDSVNANDGADGYLFSGTKAMNIGSSAFMMISRKYQKILESSGEKYDKDITIELKNSISFALALRLLKGKYDTMRSEGNSVENSEKTFEKLISDRMKLLTEYAVGKANTFTDAFIKKKSTFLKNYFTDQSEEEIAAEFGCKVVIPNHGKVDQYTGIITISFDYINGKDLKEKLLQKGYRTESMMDGKNLRISFNYFQDPEDIDVLFEEIENIHSQIFMERKEVQNQIFIEKRDRPRI